MIIVYIERLEDFAQKHADARKSIAIWKSDVEEANWNSKQDVLQDFPRARMIANNRARFEILHNAYRLIIKIRYDVGIVQVRFIGTHNEYDRINPETI
jgi:mRNA interferase HigB